MFLVVGLGNPGQVYAETRHNVGFQVVDAMAEGHDLTFVDCKWQAKIAKGSLWGTPALLVKPETYMNESGRAVGQIAAYYRVPSAQIIVLHDDLDLGLARIKVVVDRGPGGHNGIVSLISHLGGRDFVRIRIGIGRPDVEVPVKSFVLSRFRSDEQEAIRQQLPAVEEIVRLVMAKGAMAAMSAVNSKKNK